MPPRTRSSGGGADVGEGTAVGGANGLTVGPGVDVGDGARVEAGLDDVEVAVAVETGGTDVAAELLSEH